MALAFRYGRARSIFHAVVASALALASVYFAVETYDPITEIGAWAAALLAAACVVLFLRKAFDRSPAIEIRPEGVYARQLAGVVEWGEIDALRLRRRRARIFYVIPADTLELVLSVKPEADFWRRRGAYRRWLRLVAGVSGRWEVAVSLNGLGRRAARRLDAALRDAQPELTRPMEIVRRERRKARGGAPS